MLGLPEIADLIDEAVRQVFPDNQMPLDHDARNAALNRLINTPDVDPVVDQLNQRDLAYIHPHAGIASNREMLALMCDWIDHHPDRFFNSPPTPDRRSQHQC